MNRITWEPLKNSYVAKNKEGTYLGYLVYERVGQFMHWCWYQFVDIRMSPDCLQEVRDKQKELLNEVNKK